MKVERSSFLFLTAMISAATAAVACSAPSDGDAESSGADIVVTKQKPGQPTGSSSSAAAAPASHCIAKPAQGEIEDGLNFSIDLCVRLSTFSPQAEAMGDSLPGTQEMVRDQCTTFARAYRAGLSADIAACLEKVDAARRTDGIPTKPASSDALVACSRILFDVCETAIDPALAVKDANGKTRCDRIVGALGVAELDAKKCNQVLSGIRPAWRPQMEICVNDLVKVRPEKSTIFLSCMGGLLPDPNGMGPDPAGNP